MYTAVEIYGERVRLQQAKQLGAGGSEGNVFLVRMRDGQEVAVKIYHTPSQERAEKLTAFLQQTWQLPLERIALPLAAAYELKQQAIVGFAMPYLGMEFGPLARLANRKQRNAHTLRIKEVLGIFIDGVQTLERIHQQGLVVGDFSDQNTFYTAGKMVWIDVDSWQFGGYGCPVGTEDFLAPELYGQDLSLQASFTEQHDWYAFAVHLFRSLLLVHPYGGVHRELKTLIRRAVERVWVMDAGVVYPSVAYPRELLNDELWETFERCFCQGWRGAITAEVLQRYSDGLIVCAGCKQEYPGERSSCPFCKVQTRLVVVPKVAATTVGCKELLRTQYTIVFSQITPTVLNLICYEEGKVVLYQQALHQYNLEQSGARRLEVCREIPGASFALCGDVLIMNPPQSTVLYCLDISGEQPRGICQIQTELFAGNRQAVFQATQQHLYYMQNGTLFRGSFVQGELRSQVVRSVVEQQTWFAAVQESDGEQADILGFFQVFGQQLYWYIREGATYEVQLEGLAIEEVLLDIHVHFAADGALVRRFTQYRGSQSLHSAMIDTRGKVMYQSGRQRLKDEYGYKKNKEQAYMSGVLLHPTDKGIVQEQVERGQYKTFATTQPYIDEGDTLYTYRAGVIAVKEKQVLFLSM